MWYKFQLKNKTKHLQWFLIALRIRFKILNVAQKALHDLAPVYPSDIIRAIHILILQIQIRLICC